MVGAVKQQSGRKQPNQGPDEGRIKRRARRGRYVCTCKRIEEGLVDRSVSSDFLVWDYILTGPHCGSRQISGLATTIKRDSPRATIAGRHFTTDICNNYTGCSIDVHVLGFKIISFLLDRRLRQRDNPAYAVIEGKDD